MHLGWSSTWMDNVAAASLVAGDLDPSTKLPFSEDLQTTMAPQQADGAAGSGDDLCAGGQTALHRIAGQTSRSSGKRGRQQLPSVSKGNVLANYKGFLRSVPKPAAAAGFRPPRPSSPELRLDDCSAAGPSQLQQPKDPPAEDWVQQQPKQRSAPTSSQDHAQITLAAGDDPASPTEEQWESFLRRKRGRAAIPALAAAARVAAKPAGPSFFPARPPMAGMTRPGAVAQGGGLLGRLKAALQAEATVEELLAGCAPRCTPDALNPCCLRPHSADLHPNAFVARVLQPGPSPRCFHLGRGTSSEPGRPQAAAGEAAISTSSQAATASVWNAQKPSAC